MTNKIPKSISILSIYQTIRKYWHENIKKPFIENGDNTFDVYSYIAVVRFVTLLIEKDTFATASMFCLSFTIFRNSI